MLEATLALLLLSLLVAGLMPLVTLGDQAYQEGWRRQEMLRNARQALDQMMRDFQAATGLVHASAGVLRFEVGTDTGVRTVEYALQPNGDLTYRVDGGAAQPLAGPFESFRVTCYDEQGTLLQGCSPENQVRQVELHLEASDPQPDPIVGRISSLQVSTRVARRVR